MVKLISKMRRQKTFGQNFSNLEFISSINKYIPSLVLQHMTSRQERNNRKQQIATNTHNQLPELQPMETVCLFADISGFTNLSEKCANMGVRGNEELAFCINRYMEGMVKNLSKYGGDIIKFVGDAMIVMWPPPADENEPTAQQKQDTVKRAIQCALDIQREMGNLVILEGVSGLSVKIGIGYGKCALLYVGGVFNRAEFFTVGEALKYALKSEGCATNGGQIIVAGKAFECVRESYQAKELINDSGEKFYLIGKLVGEGAKTRADAQLLRSQFRPETFTSIQQQLRFWVPAAIIPYLQIGAESFGSETRSLTVMFLNLGIDLSSAETEQGMMKIQKIVTTVQQQIYRLQGSVNKLVMDDKGSTFICLWGVCPLSHEDDAARAILTGFNIIRELEKIESTKCKIGISSGEVFSGVVGTAGSRKEFSVLGDVVNLAARIMGSLKYSKQIMCTDLNTRNLAAPFFQFNYIAHKEFKGKSISLAVFEPIDPSKALVQAIEKAKCLPPEAMLFTHSNPMVLDTAQELKKKNKSIGLDNLLFDMCEKLVDFSKNSDINWPFMAVVKGEVGSGKTLFALSLIDEITSSRDFRLLQEKQGKTWIYTSSLNAESELQFLNIWRPVLQMMLINLCKRENLRKEKVIRMLMRAAGDDYRIENKLELICSILGIERDQLASKTPQFVQATPQIQPKSTPFAFVSRPDYDDRNDIIQILLIFFKIAIGETDDLSNLNLSHAKSANKSKRADSSQEESDKPMCILILDDAHMMDQASWLLFEAIRDECYRVAIILCMQTDDQDKIKINPEVKPFFEQIWFSQAMEDLVQVDLPSFDEKQLHQLILQCAQRYQVSYMDEISKMTGIVDPADTIKTVAMGNEWTQRLVNKWQLQTRFKSIEPEILQIIVNKCSGNPLICLNFFVNMLHNGVIKVDQQGVVLPTNEFIKCNQLSNWNNVPVPRLALKINCNRIDAFIQNVQQNPRKRPGDLELCITSVVILKAAVVLGDEFELRALKKVQPLSMIVSDQMLLVCLKLLEQQEMIEILDETDNKNVLCRFSKNFLRESLYQILLYRECKQQLHTAAAEYLQNSAPSSLKDPEIEAERLKQHMLKAQDIADEALLSYQSKTGLIVRRIQNLIINQPNTLIFSQLIYKEARSNGILQQRLCSLSSKHLRWYHDEIELKKGIFMGSVPLSSIISCIPSVSKDINKFGFSISTNVVYDRNLQKKEYAQNLDFCCDDRDSRDKWVISLDFLRTRAIYEDYAQKNISVKFPLKSEEEKVQEYDSNNINDLLFDFANKLKGKTVVAGMGNQNKLNLTGLPGLNGQSSFLSNKKGYRASVLAQNEDRSQFASAADLVPKLKCLYNAGIVSFLHHMNQKACKIQVRQQQAKLGQLPDRAVFEIARTTEQLIGLNSDHPRSSISSNEQILRFQNSEKRSTEKKKRRGSSNSLTEMRRPTAVFQKDNLIKEEDSDDESSVSENVSIPLTKTKKKPETNRRSQEVNDLDMSLLKENQDVDISKQIKKINEKLKPPKSESKPESRKIASQENVQVGQPEMVREDQAKLKKQTTFTPNYVEQINTQMPHRQSILNSVEESSIYKNPASEYQEMTQDLSQFSDLQTKSNAAVRLKTANFGEELSQIYAQKPVQEAQVNVNKADQTNTTDHNIIQSIEKLINKQLGRGFKDIMTQNQMLIETQQRQINQQMLLLNQSLTHNQMLMQVQSNHMHSPEMYFGSNTRGMGITSRGKNLLNASMQETPQKIQTEEDDREPEDPESQIMIGPDRDSSLNQSEIQRLYQDYPPMLQQLGTSPLRPVTRDPVQNNLRVVPIKQDLPVTDVQASELGSATAKYMQRLYKKQQKIHQQQLAQEKQQKKQQFFPLPDHLWDEDLARKPHENTRYARAVRRCQCQLVGDIMEVPTGAKVRIIERIEEIQMYRIKYDKRVGLFLMRDFKPIPDPVPILIPAPKQPSVSTQNLNKSRDQQKSFSTQKVLGAESIHEPSHQSTRSEVPPQLQDRAQPKKNFFKQRGQFDFLY